MNILRMRHKTIRKEHTNTKKYVNFYGRLIYFSAECSI